VKRSRVAGRWPTSLLVRYTSFRGPGIDLRVGFRHGLYCVACCWGLMLILVAVGVMNYSGNGVANRRLAVPTVTSKRVVPSIARDVTGSSFKRSPNITSKSIVPKFTIKFKINDTCYNYRRRVSVDRNGEPLFPDCVRNRGSGKASYPESLRSLQSAA
jgi:hypothetical protein